MLLEEEKEKKKDRNQKTHHTTHLFQLQECDSTDQGPHSYQVLAYSLDTDRYRQVHPEQVHEIASISTKEKICSN